MTFNMSCKLC